VQNVQVARACNESKDVSIKFQLILAGILPENTLPGTQLKNKAQVKYLHFIKRWPIYGCGFLSLNAGCQMANPKTSTEVQNTTI